MGAQTSDSPLQAAGRQISQKNAKLLSKAFSEIGKLLIDAGVIDKQSLENLFGEEQPANAEASSEPKVEEPIAAAAVEESFTTQVKRVTWHDRLRTTLRFFGNRYEMLHNCPESEFARRVGVDTDRETAIAQLRDDLTLILVELSKDHPGPSNDEYYYYSPYMELASASGSGEKVITVAFDCPAQAIAAAASRATNRRPVSGVLFRIDEPSESAPSVGPGLPLYVPKAIAAAAQQQQQQEQQQQFMASLQTVIKEAVSTEVKGAVSTEVSAAVAKAVNPSGQPPRKTVSLAAQGNGSGGAVDQSQMQVLLQLASLEGELAALRKNPSVDGFEEIRLVDKIAQYKREHQLA